MNLSIAFTLFVSLIPFIAILIIGVISASKLIYSKLKGVRQKRKISTLPIKELRIQRVPISKINKLRGEEHVREIHG